MAYIKSHDPWHDTPTTDTPIDAPSLNTIESGIAVGAAVADSAQSQANSLSASIRSGAGSPQNVLSAPVGTMYLRTDGTPQNTLWIKESGTGNTGWSLHSGVSYSIISSTVGGLGTPSQTGTIGYIRVGTWPDNEYVEMIWDNSITKWVSKPTALIGMSDQSFMGVNTTTYSYIATNSSGGSVGAMGWTTRPIRHAAELFAAGLKLQAAFSGLVIGAPAIFTVMPFFFNHNDAETVVGSTDGSTAAAFLGTGLVSPATLNLTFKATGWQDVLKNGTATVLASADVTKANLWPRLYGKVASGASYGSVIDVDLQYRWVA